MGRSHVASMGVYLFNKDVLTHCLQDENMADFGKHIIPASIGARKVYAHFFDGYWRDVGTIKSFYEANLELTHLVPEFDFYNESTPVYTRPRFLPGSNRNGSLSAGIVSCEASHSAPRVPSLRNRKSLSSIESFSIVMFCRQVTVKPHEIRPFSPVALTDSPCDPGSV